MRIVTGQGHVLFLATLDFGFHHNLQEAHRLVSLKAVGRLSLVACFIRATIQHLGISSPLPVEVLQSWSHVDVEGFLEWQFSRAFGCVHHCGLFRSDGVMIFPGMFCYC